ncbi:MAG: DUF2288 family protein [Gammaproteobacteria bacterium]|nr:DUF2288 family protein [Gammaproteobacteria bacterium]
MSDQLTNEELQAKLNLETAKITWKELELFFAKGKLLIVQAESDLIQLASAIHNDEKSAVEDAIDKNLIFYPTPEWIKQNCIDGTLFWGLVIAPFVLAQPISN